MFNWARKNNFKNIPHVERFAQASRSHWGIENQLHWCLDVAFNEDSSRIRSGYAPENMTLIRHLALNLLGQETSLKVGKKAMQRVGRVPRLEATASRS